MTIYKQKSHSMHQMEIHSVKSQRVDFFYDRYKNDRLLHVGCVGTHIVNQKGLNLHETLLSKGMDVDGYDIDKDGVRELSKKYPEHPFVSDLNELELVEYDTVIVPEVLEHTNNPDEFLMNIFSINASSYFISVPNVFGHIRNVSYNDVYTQEIVHPDHYCWYSPYTLFNITRKYHTEYMNMFYLQGRKQVAIEINI